MVRKSFAFLLIAALGTAGAAFSQEVTPHAHDAGLMKGTITAVDYQRGVITVAALHRGTIAVMVVPSTNIQGPGTGYHAINDLIKGSKVQIWASQVGDRYIAQIIRLGSGSPK